MTDNTATVAVEADRGAIAISILLLAGAVVGLFAYKWSGSSTVIGSVRVTRGWSGSFHGLIDGGVLAASWLIGGLFVATIAVLIALPTFFEIPIAVALMSAGSPAAAAAVLIAGPAINAGSLMVVGKEIGARAATLIGGAVWIVACVAVVTFASTTF